jgi:thiamine pyrophosphokinase
LADILYRAHGPVTLVGGGPLAPADLAAALELAPDAVAADGGGDRPLPGGVAFRAVIGDMDSLRDAARLRAAGVAVFEVAEQDSTDLEKCLYSVEAPLFVGLGFLGGRIDHHLAAMNALAKHPAKRVVLIGGEDLCFLCPPRFEIALAAGTRVSLFPMGEVAGQEWEGLRWPADGSFRPDGRIGTSNAAVGGPVRLGFDAPRMLVILPAALLGRVVDRLRDAPPWPVRPPG